MLGWSTGFALNLKASKRAPKFNSSLLKLASGRRWTKVSSYARIMCSPTHLKVDHLSRLRRLRTLARYFQHGDGILTNFLLEITKLALHLVAAANFIDELALKRVHVGIQLLEKQSIKYLVIYKYNKLVNIIIKSGKADCWPSSNDNQIKVN